jgi:hypothetical protein
VATAAWTAVMAPVGIGIVLLGLNWSTAVPVSPIGYHAPYGFLALIVIASIYVSVGAFVLARQPGNAFGWIFCGIGLLSAAELISSQYATYALLTRAGALPGGPLAGWIYESSGAVVATGSSIFVPLLFPNGMLPSRLWRPVLVLGVVAIAILVAGAILYPGPLPIAIYVTNPFGLGGATELAVSMIALAVGLVVATIGLSIVSLVPRYRRAKILERQQIKWIAYAAGLHSTALVAYVLFLRSSEFATEAIALLAVLIPIATGLAILRYRLYDIDLLIRRTLTYAVLSAALFAAYLTGVALIQFVFSPVTSGNGLAVAISTLAVVALFQPLRRRIQSSVDRRFYRRRYDAVRTLDTFAVRLRDEIDLDALRAELITAVGASVQPTHASLWLRGTR